jgi:hypothetical protein
VLVVLVLVLGRGRRGVVFVLFAGEGAQVKGFAWGLGEVHCEHCGCWRLVTFRLVCDRSRWWW